MTKSKSTQATQPQMTRQERKDARKQISELSKVSPKELIEMLRKDPDGGLTINVIMDALWPKFRTAFKIAMPQKGPHTSQAVYDRQLKDYQAWAKGIRSIGRFWYICGTLHKQNFDELLSILDEDQDAAAPETIEETETTQEG